MRSPDPPESRGRPESQPVVESNRYADTLRRFLAALRPLLREHSARSAWIVGSHARGTAGPESDIDVIVVAPTPRPSVERFRDYLPAIVAAGVGVDLVVYTPAEFEQLRREGRPFLRHAMQSAVAIEV